MLDKEKTGLIVVDIQGKLARIVDNSSALIANCQKLIKGAQAIGLPIIYLEQTPDRLGSTVSELDSLLINSNPISKFTFNACKEPKFIEAIQAEDVNTWLICGIEAHICVYQTAMNLLELNYQIQLVNDCISSRTLENKNLAINKLIHKGADNTAVEMCLYELVKDCRAPEFKQVLSLVR